MEIKGNYIGWRNDIEKITLKSNAPVFSEKIVAYDAYELENGYYYMTNEEKGYVLDSEPDLDHLATESEKHEKIFEIDGTIFD